VSGRRATSLACALRTGVDALFRSTLAALVIAAAGFGAGSAVAADPLTMTARALLDGHARLGTWMAIQVDLENAGQPVSGELRLTGGVQGQTRFGTPVDLPTGSRKRYTLYAQPPAFGDRLEVAVVAAGKPVATRQVAFAAADPSQLLVGVVAEHPDRIIGDLGVLTTPNTVPPAIVALTIDSLPERVEALSAIDRLVWQDVDASDLSPAQLGALRGWVAQGGRLVIVGGTGGPGLLSAFPDELLPYRPSATVDVPASVLGTLLGELPSTATDLTALGGPAGAGRTLAAVGDRVVAAELTFGNGSVTILGFDPTTPWIADSKADAAIWRRVLPARSGSAAFTSGADDSQLVNAVSSLSAAALPPIGGLFALLVAYIVLIGPVNYLVLRRLGRRELAWLTMPALIGVFAVAAYVFGASLRGTDILVNEVALVRGAPGTDAGQGQVYLGVFSPGRGTYQLEIPGGALLTAPISQETGGMPGAGSLDVLQGDPARVRDLAVGFSSIRTIRADTPLPAPNLAIDLRLEDRHLKGTVTNHSSSTVEGVAVVLGASVAKLGDLGPGASATVDVEARGDPLGQSLSDKLIGQVFFGDPARSADATGRAMTRRAIIDQLSFDPNFGPTGTLNADGPMVLGWGSNDPLAVSVEGREPRLTGNVLYLIPASMRVQGAVSFGVDLVRSTVVASDAAVFNKGPMDLNFGQGSVTVAYRPVAFEGSIRATGLALEFNAGADIGAGGGTVEPVGPPPSAAPTTGTNFDGLPEVDLFDRIAGAWVRLPHLGGGVPASIKDPERYVDPTGGSVLVRFVNDRTDSVGFQFAVRIDGEVR
jgi:hypothetical protein